MNEANYILKTNEAVLMPTERNVVKIILKRLVWSLVAVIVAGSLIFQINIFSAMSLTARILLIVLVVAFGFYGGKKEYTPSPMELQFYDDRLVFYLPKRYYSDRVSRKQINMMKYSDITRCAYLARSKRIHIFGDGHSLWYNYKKDGSLPSEPSHEHDFTNGLIYFNVQFATNVDIIKEIEEHSPIKVIVENR